jgi:hypothetical protein
MTNSSHKQPFTIVELLVVLFAAAIFSFRLISLPLLVLALIAGFRGWRGLQWACWALFVAACLSPVDVALPGFPGFVSGKPRSGVRLVIVVPHMPVRAPLLARYGEFMEYNGLSLYPPLWVIVWC